MQLAILILFTALLILFIIKRIVTKRDKVKSGDPSLSEFKSNKKTAQSKNDGNENDSFSDERTHSSGPEYYYKIFEIIEDNEKETEVREYEFKVGDFRTNKLDAKDWYKKRKLSIEINKLYKTSNKEDYLKQSLKLFLLEYYDEQRQNEYLLIDENGVENIENRLFEANAIKRFGGDYKNTKSYNNREFEIISTKNAYLDGKHPGFKL